MIGIAALAIVVVIFVLLPRSDNGSPPNDGASASATASTPTIEPTSTPDPTPEPVAVWTGLTWSDPVTPSFVVHVYDLLPWGDGYVAVGAVEVDATRSCYEYPTHQQIDHCEAVFMTSPDGLNWVITEQQEAGLDRYPRHLVALGDELLAFSNRATTEGLNLGASPGSAYYGALIWSSTDGGATWSRIDSPSWEQAWTDARVGLMPDGWDYTQSYISTGLVEVASGPDGLVSIGNSYGDNELVPVLLQSTDGTAWLPMSLPAGSPSALLHDVVPFDDGFVMVGSVNVGPRAETATPAAWYSADSVTWSRATVNVDEELYPDGLEGIGDFASATPSADGLLGWYGYRELTAGGPTTFAAWSSTDGHTWVPLGRDTYPPPYIRHVASDGVRMVGFPDTFHWDTGQTSPIDTAGVSTDGVSWSELALSAKMSDQPEGFWVVPDGVIYAGVQSFWFATATTSP
jgi:hypothetical protein